MELNPGAKFVLSFRKPSTWLKSFYEYRRAELSGGANAWALRVGRAYPHLLDVTFEDVVSRSPKHPSFFGLLKDAFAPQIQEL